LAKKLHTSCSIVELPVKLFYMTSAGFCCTS